jgi:diguanylate cyclase (GGDEF)-like protein
MKWRGVAVSAVLDRVPVGVAVATPDGVVHYANPHLRALLGMLSGRWKSCPIACLRAPASVDDAVIRRALARRGHWEGESVLAVRGGGTRAVREWVYALPRPGPAASHVHFVQDLTLSRQVETLTRLAYYDGLTGLPNRNLLWDRLEQAVARSLRSGRPFAVLYLDIDGFKTVNDTAGHAAGDELLRQIAQRLRGAARRSDTIARLAGDEFVILAEQVDAPRAAAHIADKLLRACRHALPGGRLPGVTASLGISFFPHDAADIGTLLDKADEALYRAKALGPGRHVFAASLVRAARPPSLARHAAR